LVPRFHAVHKVGPVDPDKPDHVGELTGWLNGLTKSDQIPVETVERKLKAAFARALDEGLDFEVDTGSVVDVRLWPVVVGMPAFNPQVYGGGVEGDGKMAGGIENRTYRHDDLTTTTDVSAVASNLDVGVYWKGKYGVFDPSAALTAGVTKSTSLGYQSTVG